LKDIAIVEKDYILSIGFALLFYIGVNASKASTSRATIDEIVREEVAMYIACLYDLYCSSFWLSGYCR
jgi:hypothetical protein